MTWVMETNIGIAVMLFPVIIATVTRVWLSQDDRKIVTRLNRVTGICFGFAVLTVLLEGMMIYRQQIHDLNSEVMTQYFFEVWMVFVFGAVQSINVWKEKKRSN